LPARAGADSSCAASAPTRLRAPPHEPALRPPARHCTDVRLASKIHQLCLDVLPRGPASSRIAVISDLLALTMRDTHAELTTKLLRTWCVCGARTIDLAALRSP